MSESITKRSAARSLAAHVSRFQGGGLSQVMDLFRQYPWLWSLLFVLLGFLPILASFFRQQWGRPEYQAFPIMLVAAGIFLSSRLAVAAPVQRQSWWLNGPCWALAILAWATLAASFFVFSPWLAMVAFVIYSAAVAGTIWQHWRLPGLWGIWLLLALLVPLPLDRDRMLIERMQLFSSQVTSMILDAIGVLHVAQGNALTLSDRQLFVDEACSGIVSVISIIYCIAIYGLWQYRGAVHLLLLMLIGVTWTVMMNSLRLTTIAIGWDRFQIDLVEGWPHMLLGLLMFAISAGVLFAVDRFLLSLLAPIDTPDGGPRRGWRSLGPALVAGWNVLVSSPDPPDAAQPPTQTAGQSNWQVRQAASQVGTLAPSSVLGRPATGGFAALGLVYLILFLPLEISQQSNIRRALKRASELDATSVPLPGEDWQLLSFSGERREIFSWDHWGQYSRTYNLQDSDGFAYQLSCDFLFGPHWHDLRACYRGTGWRIQEERVLEFDKLPTDLLPVVRVESSLTAPPLVEQFTIGRSPDLLDGLITYGAFRANGKWFNRPRGEALWQDFWAHVVQGRDRAEQADYFQVQVTTFYEGEISPVQQLRSQQLLHHGLDWFRQHLTAP